MIPKGLLPNAGVDRPKVGLGPKLNGVEDGPKAGVVDAPNAPPVSKIGGLDTPDAGLVLPNA